MSSTRPDPSAARAVAGHRRRLRQRFLNSGLNGFNDYEVIELLLTLNTPRKDCKPAAKQALKRFGSLPAVLEATAAELTQIAGIGPQNVFGIRLVKAVADAYFRQRLINSEPLSNSRQLFDYLRQTLAAKKREQFDALFLDAKNRVLKTETLFVGTLGASSVYPREVVRAALDAHAAALIFAHNHPSGDPKPSAADYRITRRLVYACRSVDVNVHEHLIVGTQGYYSFADNGEIEAIKRDFDQMLEV